MIHARKKRIAAIAAASAAMLGACASAPVHYYTLVAPDVQNLVPAGPDTATAIPFMLLAHAVPAEVDQPQLIVRTGAVQAAVLEGERWIAPLGDEIQVALGADLARALPGQDVTALAAGGKSVLHIQLNLRRFESSPGAYALIEAAWSLRLQGNSAQSPLTCTSTIREGVESGYDSLVRGHQRALGRLAAAIAAAARPYVAGQPARCP